MKNLYLLVAIAFLGISTGTATEAMQSYISSVGGYADGTAGWSFTPTANISVTDLGVLDYIFPMPNESPLSVGLWDQNGTLLASSSVASNSFLLNNTRYEAVTPVNLSAGLKYYIGAYATSGTIILLAESPGNVNNPGSATMASEIQLGTALSNPTGFGIPNTDAGGGPGSAFLAPNFQFVDAVPEPSSGALLVLGAALLTKSRMARTKSRN